MQNFTKTLCLLLCAFISSNLLHAQAPTITSFTPLTGAVGTSVTISGTGFNTAASNNVVFFGATRATVTTASATSLKVTVPQGATYAAITVLNTGTVLAAYSDAYFTPVFTPNTGSITTHDFTTHTDSATGTSPYGVAIGDLDGDGKPDLAIANYAANTVSVLLNTGSGGHISFAAHKDFATGTKPYSVAIGDIDGDGRPDLATTDFTDSVSVLLNTGSTGSISFAIHADFATGNQPYGVAIGDMDGDGKLDLATANQLDNTVSVLLNTGTGTGTTSFATHADFATGNQPYCVAISDMDGDGKPDLEVTNFNSNSVSVLLNTGTTTGTVSFGAHADFATGTKPISIATGDMDGDGKTDIVVANFSNTNIISVLLNASTGVGNINFVAHADFPTGGQPYGVAIGDLDGDGRPDLAISNPTTNTVSVLRNMATSPGSINFSAHADLASGNQPGGLAIGDLDGDGKPDIAVANNGANTVSFLLNVPIAQPAITSFTPTSAGQGSTVTITGTGFTGATAVSFGDTAAASFVVVNATTITAVVAAGATGYVSVTTPGGTDSASGFIFITPPSVTSFTPVTGYTGTTVTITGSNFTGATGVNFGAAAATSFTVVNSTTITAKVGAGATGSVSVTGAGGTSSAPGFSFLPPAPVITSFSPITGVAGATITINGSNFNTTAANNVVFFGATRATVTTATATKLTVKVPPSATYAPITALNTVTSLGAYSRANFTPVFAPSKDSISLVDFAPHTDLSTGNNPQSVAISDIDGDGRADMIVANFADNTLSILLSNGTGGFAAQTVVATGSGPTSVAVGDIDGDGRPDLAIVCQGDNAVAVSLNASSPGKINFGVGYKEFGTNLNTPQTVAIADLDGDGRPDIAVTNFAANTVSVLQNSGAIGSSSFNNEFDYNTGNSPYGLAIGDLNGDGKPDLAVTNLSDNTVSVLLNSSGVGNMIFAANTVFTTGGSPVGIAIGDLNGDGKPDLAISNFGDNTTSVLLNAGVAGFSPNSDFATGGSPISVALADIDGDGKVDIVTANNTDNTVSVLRNTSAGNLRFDAHVDLATGNAPYAVAASDLNGDGRADIAAANSSDNTVSYIFNTPQLPPAIISFKPASAGFGSTVTITGSGFTGTTAVSFGSIAATSFVVINDITINAIVGTGSTGSVSVTTPLNTATANGFVYLPLTASVKGSVAACMGTTTPPVVSFVGNYGLSPFIFTYTVNGGLQQTLATGAGDSVATLTVPTSAAGTFVYSLVKVQDANSNQQSVSGSATVTISQPITFTTSIAPASSCGGGSNGILTVSRAGGQWPYEFTLTLSGGAPFSQRNNNTFNNLAAGTYSLTVTDTAGCTTTASSLVVTQAAPITITSSLTPVSGCSGGTNGTINASRSGGLWPYEFTLTGPGGTTVTQRNNGFFSGLATGTYSITVTDTAGCTGAEPGITITQPAAITLAPTTTVVSSCHGGSDGSISAGRSGGAWPYEFTLTGPGSSTVTQRNNAVFSNLAAGTYSLSVIDTTGCTATTTGIVVAQATAITVALTVSPVSSCGSANSGTISASKSGGAWPYEFVLTGPGSSTSTQRNNGVFSNLAAGTYSLTVTDTTGCTGTATGIVVPQTPALTVAPFATPVSSCGSANSGMINVNRSGGIWPYQFALTGSGGTTVTQRNDWVFSNLATGTYSVTVTDTTGCTGIATGIVITKAAGLALAPTTTPVGNCGAANNGTITSNRSGGIASYVFTLTKPGGSTVTQRNNGVFSGLATGTYSIIVTDTTGCADTAKSIVVKPTGCPSSIDPVSKNSLQTELKIKVYPNPAVNEFALILEGGDNKRNVEITVVDMYGKALYHTTGTVYDQYKFGKTFAGGIYIAQVVNGNFIKTIKLVKGN